jgi:DNA-binding CsgD family transcriptional regulator
MTDTVHLYPAPARPAGEPALSRMLMDLYQRVMDVRGGSLEAGLFDWMPAHLAFDAAWVGHSTFTALGPVLHASVLHGLPDDYVADWLGIRAEDPTVKPLSAAPGEPVRLSRNDAGLTPRTRAFLRRHGLTQVLCNIAADPALKTVMHLSLYRRGAAAPFSSADLDLLRGLMPHLAAAATLNRAYRARLPPAAAAQPVCLAVCSPLGMVQFAEPAFVQLLRLEWPDWPGGSLPATLLRASAGGEVAGRQVSFRLQASDAALVVKAQPRSPLDRLSPGERRVAELFGAGRTYKSVARELRLSPHTVRHYLRQAYAKLDIRDKGQIAWLLSQGNGVAAPGG